MSDHNITKSVRPLRNLTRNPRTIYLIVVGLALIGITAVLLGLTYVRDITLFLLLPLIAVALIQTQHRLHKRVRAQLRSDRQRRIGNERQSDILARAAKSNSRNKLDSKVKNKTPKRTSSIHPLSQFEYGSLRWYANAPSYRPRKEALRLMVLHRIVQGRDVLARQASGGMMSYQDIVSLLEDYRSGLYREKVNATVSRMKPATLLSLARIVYRQSCTPDDNLNALALFQMVQSVFGDSKLTRRDWEDVVSCMISEGRYADSEDLLEDVEKFSANNYHWWLANAINPFVEGRDARYEEWLDVFNETYKESDRAIVHVDQTAVVPFTTLRTKSQAGRIDGDLISVLMPVYKADHFTDLAIKSILDQTWKNFELLIIDDGSPRSYHERLARWEQQDNRVQVIYSDINCGTYTARNIGLAKAKGRWVTTQDADDWSHPERLEAQAIDLERNPHKVANWVQLVRVNERLEVQRCRGGNPLQHNAMVSIMFERRPVLENIGYWDSVRKGADSEFRSRIELKFHQQIENVSSAPLMLGLYDTDSLSGRDIYRGHTSQERLVYRRNWKRWHAEIASGDASAYLPAKVSERPFLAPPQILPDQPSHEKFDVIFVSELGFTGGNSHSLANEIKLCLDAGLRVGIIRLHNLLFPATGLRDVSPVLEGLFSTSGLIELAITENVKADLVIVRWPACLQYLPEVDVGLKAGSLLIVANHPPFEGANGRHTYEIGTISRNARRFFGVEPVWAPQSEVVRRMLSPHLSGHSLLATDWVGVLHDFPKTFSRNDHFVDRVPVIGRHSRDHYLKWPEERAALLAAYPIVPEYKVKILGGVKSILAANIIEESEVATWEVYEFGSVSPMDFLKQLDFFVYYTHKNWVEAYGRVIMEALVAGVVVVLPPEHEPTFGQAAVYARAADVLQTVEALYNNRDEYVAQRERGFAYVESQSSPASYLRRLAGLGVSVPHGPSA